MAEDLAEMLSPSCVGSMDAARGTKFQVRGRSLSTDDHFRAEQRVK